MYPTFLIIGALKCGTSSLHYYLDLHPEIAMSRPKELNFFIDDSPEGGRPKAEYGNWSRGTDWYQQHFPADTSASVLGEASPHYTVPSHGGVAERINSLLPEVKLIYLIRDPIDRMVSHYLHERAVGREARTMEEALCDERGPYFQVSQYWASLVPFLARFPTERLLLLRQEDLLVHRRAVIRQVFEFLDVDVEFWSPHYTREKNRSSAKGVRYRLVYPMWNTRVMKSLPPKLRWYLSRAVASRDRPRPSLTAPLRHSLERQIAPDWERMQAYMSESQ